ncbi:hypothetical protein [Burkholderia sp. Ac-20365]|uniref:hypothetical protein n=1 Tax=Burkholderia sp. Ac-20365 TaxID=2703897 RepID=UPI00197B3219|nr:hypothetical protein [Burkholderia sp. Ac-20365]MBN3762370.1 hypothetical protein [Burkholderia sp. Ac-20365]
MLLKLTAADHGRVLNDGSGLSGTSEYPHDPYEGASLFPTAYFSQEEVFRKGYGIGMVGSLPADAAQFATDIQDRFLPGYLTVLPLIREEIRKKLPDVVAEQSILRELVENIDERPDELALESRRFQKLNYRDALSIKIEVRRNTVSISLNCMSLALADRVLEIVELETCDGGWYLGPASSTE